MICNYDPKCWCGTKGILPSSVLLKSMLVLLSRFRWEPKNKVCILEYVCNIFILLAVSSITQNWTELNWTATLIGGGRDRCAAGEGWRYLWKYSERLRNMFVHIVAGTIVCVLSASAAIDRTTILWRWECLWKEVPCGVSLHDTETAHEISSGVNKNELCAVITVLSYYVHPAESKYITRYYKGIVLYCAIKPLIRWTRK